MTPIELAGKLEGLKQMFHEAEWAVALVCTPCCGDLPTTVSTPAYE